MNASAVLIFVFTSKLDWSRVAVVAAGAIVGGVIGGWLLRRVNEKLQRGFVVIVGLALTIGLFLRAV
jgi:hypothetical protein